MIVMSRFGGATMVLAVLGGCSGSLGRPKSDAGQDGPVRDGSGLVDRPSSDGIVDSSGADHRDGGATGSCLPLDVATDCPGGADQQCQPTWAEVLAHPYCEAPGSPIGPLMTDTHVDCGSYQVRRINFTDFGETYVYDSASGALVGIYKFLSNSTACWGRDWADGTFLSACAAQATPACTVTGLTVDGGFYGSELKLYDGGVLGDGSTNCISVASTSPTSWPGSLNAPCAGDGGADAGTFCYASCEVSGFKYVGCLSTGSDGSSQTLCHANCSECR